MKFMESQEVIPVIGKRIHDRDHWILLGCSRMSNDLIIAIEKEFYDGEAAADFDLFMVMPSLAVGMFGIFTAKKSRMSKEQLESFLKTTFDEGRDIICAPDAHIPAIEWFEKTFRSYGSFSGAGGAG